MSNSASSTFDVAIAGAGIVGAACAWQLAKAGLRVGIADTSFVGGGATAAGMGHIVVMDDSEAQFRLTSWSRQLWSELSGELPAGAEYSECGTLWVASTDAEMAEAGRKRDYALARGVEATLLNAREVSALEPRLRPGLSGALLVPGDGVVYAPAAARWMLAQAVARGVVYRQGQSVESLHDGGMYFSDGSHWSAGALVNAAGVDAPRLTPGLPVQARKGHLAITDRAPGFIAHQIVELGYLERAHSRTADSVAFNICPRPTGQILIGSSRQFGVTSAAVDRPILEAMLNRALSYMPALANLSAIRCWTGFRAATPDNLPLIGPHPHLQGVWVAAGHEGLGITTSLGTAQLLTSFIAGSSSGIPAGPYLPARYAGKDHGV
jgi:glycine/D-amino acid oxidase-like deaminating enzyme